MYHIIVLIFVIRVQRYNIKCNVINVTPFAYNICLQYISNIFIIEQSKGQVSFGHLRACVGFKSSLDTFSAIMTPFS